MAGGRMLRPRVGLGTASADMYDVFRMSRGAAQKAENDEDTTAPKAAKVDSDIYQYHSEDKDDFFVHVAPFKRKPRRQRKKNDLGGFIVRKGLALYIVSRHDFDHPCTSKNPCIHVSMY